MRILVHDFSGHPFQVQLSRELSRRGQDVVYSSCGAYVSGKGRLTAGPGETLAFQTIGDDIVFDKSSFVRRLFQELRLGVELVRHVRAVRPDVALMSNVQVPTLVVFALAMMVTRTPWVLWHQDVYSVAIRSFAGAKLSRAFGVVASAFEVAERWCSRRSSAVVVIADSFVPVHESWGTADKVTVIPNWAPLDEIVPCPRKNDWAVEHELDDTLTLLYSGTLGLKHDPALMVSLADQVRRAGRDVRLVVVNEGPAVELLQREADRLLVPITLLPFQPYEQLSEVLATGDVLVVLLDQQAGAFSVPSKTLSYLCAGRPIVGLMPAENAAADLVTRTGGAVFAPSADDLPAAARWVAELLGDPDRRDDIGAAARELAESEFAMSTCADRFETVLRSSVGDRA
ncbi:glycosyltransferase family 4 protein [Aeromicrobium fastidiosum]|uniref:Glycosyltransferase family 4 protein n=1 Tax=Aeromicrobium fastidiosum TaxID=52699 RepID=A0A641ANK5_9ACTN|nr:glycosyltransferase family 4 protein [Aeromicrobium fastidiosum]KAA1378713.1 glycosyltransferase family 4 protein [Aeromicrobium fastidiosum]MBP2392299.1 glycosyltransferase involved in cell wall biosynthesis [Aeromicrobium fastidiosum]